MISACVAVAGVALAAVALAWVMRDAPPDLRTFELRVAPDPPPDASLVIITDEHLVGVPIALAQAFADAAADGYAAATLNRDDYERAVEAMSEWQDEPGPWYFSYRGTLIQVVLKVA